MPAKDKYHTLVVKALEAEGWTITHDPLPLSYGYQDLYVDLGAERGAIAAEKAGEKIAVEVKSFLSKSAVKDLEEAVGQFFVYRKVLRVNEPDRKLFLAVPATAYASFLARPFGQFILQGEAIPLLVFDVKAERIQQWIS